MTFKVTYLRPTDNGKVKSFAYDNGSLSKTLDNGAHQFTYTVVDFADLREFKEFLTDTVEPGHALMFSNPKNNIDEGFLLASSMVDEFAEKFPNDNCIAATKAHMAWNRGAGILMLDLDELPNHSTVADIPKIMQPIFDACPALADYQYVTASSSSALIWSKDENKYLRGLTGLHVYFVIDRGQDAKRCGDILFDRLVLSGRELVKISKAGRQMKRTDIDNAVWQATRLDFAGGSIMKTDNIDQHRDVQIWNPTKGWLVETARVFVDLTAKERKQVERIWKDAIADSLDEAARVREDWIAAQPSDKQSVYRDLAERQMLLNGFVLTTDTGKQVNVSEILGNPKKYHGLSVLDPVTGETGKSMIIAKASGEVILRCLDQGGIVYKLATDAGMQGLMVNRDGSLKPTHHNTEIALRYISQRDGLPIRYNEFADTIELGGNAVQDHMFYDLKVRCEREDLFVSMDAIFAQTEVVARANSYHPVREYLKAQTWDGSNRLDTWLVDYCGVEDKESTRLIARRFFIAMVARVMKPGAKVDTVLTLHGAQGAKKTSLVEAIAGGPEYFSNSLPAITTDSREARMHLAGKWIIEIGEMAATRNADNNSIKNFLSATVDKIRRPYLRNDSSVPRQCVFVRTVNNDDFLTDTTGNRRYWTVSVGDNIDLAGFKAARDQLFAEAVVAYENGERWWFEGDEEALLDGDRQKFMAEDAWEHYLAKRLNDIEYKDVDRFTYEDLREVLNLRVESFNTGHIKRIRKVMLALGWELKNPGNKKTWARPKNVRVESEPNQNVRVRDANVFDIEGERRSKIAKWKF